MGGRQSYVPPPRPQPEHQHRADDSQDALGRATLLVWGGEAEGLPMTGCSALPAMQCAAGVPPALVRRGLLGRDRLVTRTLCSPGPRQPRGDRPEEALRLPQRLAEQGRALGRRLQQRAAAQASAWWERYEEFVGLNEVREAQGNVAEAEKVFMVARGLVREAHEQLEAQQAKLKAVRDRLDRISKEDSQYLELATLEHRMLQEEKRLRTAHLRAEDAEREKFSLFSAAVRESHEKERARAERTKNWSLIGSVLGALIGVAGSTYVNRVRLQELKALLLEAQKGPASLQEAIREQASSYSLQHRDLHGLIADLRGLVPAEPAPGSGPPAGPPARGGDADALSAALREQLGLSRQVCSCLEGLQEQLGGLEKTLGQVAGVAQLAKADPALPGAALEPGGLVLVLPDLEQRLEARVNRNTIYSTLATCLTIVATMPMLYMLFRAS
ncbi:mitochondrial potassium channel isoform X2 [Pipistrellus kuhlii]|uniref:mitochondrial potassium channel isoform X2 n=1 Tax=Pipistrellus kuhlii TaxID=59472 RepID=UPI001E2735C2|nr:mitochondrial potassium channel isoform X2 [Pipistrellus kuhlii]